MSKNSKDRNEIVITAGPIQFSMRKEEICIFLKNNKIKLIVLLMTLIIIALGIGLIFYYVESTKESEVINLDVRWFYPTVEQFRKLSKEEGTVESIPIVARSMDGLTEKIENCISPERTIVGAILVRRSDFAEANMTNMRIHFKNGDKLSEVNLKSFINDKNYHMLPMFITKEFDINIDLTNLSILEEIRNNVDDEIIYHPTYIEYEYSDYNKPLFNLFNKKKIIIEPPSTSIRKYIGDFGTENTSIIVPGQ
jgi:hypothetical protein